MKRIILFISFLTFRINCSAQEGSPASKDAIATVRNFRNLLNSYPEGQSRDSLLKYTVDMINSVKSLSDTSRLNRINRYFLNLSSILRNNNEEERSSSMGWIVKDLALKSALPDSTIQLGIVSFKDFGEPKQIVITAIFADGAKAHSVCRLYWDYFYGGTEESIIRKNKPVGSSDLLSNPFKVNIGIPGYYTFWLVDQQNHKTYKGDVTYKKLTNNGPLEISFSIIN